MSKRAWARDSVLLGVIAIALLGCGARAAPPSASAPAPIDVESPRTYVEAEPPSETRSDARLEHRPNEIQLTGALAGASAVRRMAETYAVQQLLSGAAIGFSSSQAPAPPQPPAPVEVNGAAKAGAEMVDVVARVELEVESIARAVAKVRALVQTAGGQVVNDVITDQPSEQGAALSIRLPSGRLQQLLDDLPGLGKLRSRRIEARDIGREYHDAEIVERNLEAALRRYEELLQKATTVEEMIPIEAALSRVRTQLDRVRGDLRWLQDRGARSTVYVTLAATAPDTATIEPEAKLHPGVRGTLFVDVPGEGPASAFLGGGLSMHFARWFSVDMDLTSRIEGGDGIDAFLLTAGSELYSDFLGGGTRRALNPYFGIRGGYVRLLGEDVFAAGGALGVELYKTDIVLLDLQTRAYALIGPKGGIHGAVQPSLAFNVSY